MARLDSTPTPEKAISDLKACIKTGRDLIGRGKWSELLSLVKDIKELLDYIHTWSDVLPYDIIKYKNAMTNTLLKVIAEAKEQIMFEFPNKNFYGYPLEIDGETNKKRILSRTWSILEAGFDMVKIYCNIEGDENLGVFDKYEDTSVEMPDILREKDG